MEMLLIEGDTYRLREEIRQRLTVDGRCLTRFYKRRAWNQVIEQGYMTILNLESEVQKLCEEFGASHGVTYRRIEPDAVEQPQVDIREEQAEDEMIAYKGGFRRRARRSKASYNSRGHKGTKS
jgi:hypothetical protein